MLIYILYANLCKSSKHPESYSALDEQIRIKLFMQIIYLFIVLVCYTLRSILKPLITVNEQSISYVLGT